MKERTQVTANAFNHALRLIKEHYPDMAEDCQIKQAYKLAEKICRRAKR